MATEEVLQIPLHGNPAVSQELLKKTADINEKLGQYGFDLKPQYRLAPALGGDVVSKPQAPTAMSRNTAYGALSCGS